MHNASTHIEPLYQTPEQRLSGSLTFRVFIDGAWRNIEGQASWKSLSQNELAAQIQQAYINQKSAPKPQLSH